ncbi:hypothetical protein [Paenibacillus agilis]|uniref:DUF1433 domain-containing protein n=1 Tax=Paenibacillus agilis TaxID=3020863 RepID=A0A559J1P7_9BACL|nr:hypothetical protein [Paenibacillus agilis]TVX93771.1 hypothetical protein FPZ44_12325 [Paenibacillus agilis]
MKKLKSCVFVTILLSFFFTSTVYGTTWEDLKPEEVIKRATIVVEGKFDFSTHYTDGASGLTIGYDFKVDKLYKGHEFDLIMVAADENDKEWIEKHQNNNG